MDILFVFWARFRDPKVMLLGLFTVVGIAVGVFQLFGSQTSSASLGDSVRSASKEIVGTTQYQLVSRGPDGVSDALLGKVKQIPGVAAALPLVERQATVIGPTGRRASIYLYGVDPRFIPAGSHLRENVTPKQLAHQQVVAIPKPIAQAVGAKAPNKIRLQIGADVVEVLFGAVLQKADVGALVDSPVVLAPVAYVQQLVGMQRRVSRIFVRVQPNHERAVQAALQRLASAEHLNAEPAGWDAKLFDVASSPTRQSQALFSGISATVGFLFAFCAMLLTVPERRKLINDMKLSGGTLGKTVAALLFDALVLGVLGCALGLALGELALSSFFHTPAGYLSYAFPVGSQRIVTFQTVAISVTAGMVAALVGVLVPVRHILAPTLEHPESREAGASSSWKSLLIVVGLTCLGITTGVLLMRPSSAVLGNITLIIALFALLPFFFDLLMAGFSRLQERLGSSSLVLALLELEEPLTRVRSLAVAATGALALYSVVAILGAQHNLQMGLDQTATQINRVTDLWISPTGEDNTLGTNPFPASIERRLTQLQDVKTVSIYRGGFIDIGDRRAWVIAPPRTSPQLVPRGLVITGNPTRANEEIRGGGWVVVSKAVAANQHLHIGTKFELPSPIPTTLKVAALITNAGWPPGAIIMNSADYAHAWNSTSASALNVTLARGITPVQGRKEIMQALGSYPGLSVQTAAQREAQWRAVSRQGLSRLSQIARLILIAAVLSMVGVISSMMWQRRDQFGYTKRQGVPDGGLWLALIWECAVLLGTGCIIGATFGVFGELLISHALATVTGFPIVIHVGFLAALESVAKVAVPALVCVTVPAYITGRVAPTTISPISPA